MTSPTPPSSALDELAETLFTDEHRPLLRAILDDSSEGICIVDTTGRQLYINPETRRLLGQGLTASDPETWTERYGVFYPDMRTPCPNERIPLYRAMKGETVVGEDYFVRHAGLPLAEADFAASAREPLPQQKLLHGFAWLRDLAAAAWRETAAPEAEKLAAR